MISLSRFNSIKCNIKWRMPQYIHLFPVCKFIGAALQHSTVKQNATRICSTYTTALNPMRCIPFSSCLLSLFTGEKSCLLLDKVSSFNELIYWLVFDSGNDKVNTQSSLKALQMHRIKNSIIKCGCTLKVRSETSVFVFYVDSILIFFNRLKVGATVLKSNWTFPQRTSMYSILILTARFNF